MSHFTGEDLIFYKDSNNGKIMSGGYLIDSIMLKNSISPMTTYHYKGGFKDKDEDDVQDEKNVSSIFENLAVPAGLFYMNERTPISDSCDYQSSEPLSDDLHESLLALVEISTKNKSKGKTRKNKIKGHSIKTKQTYKNKNSKI